MTPIIDRYRNDVVLFAQDLGIIPHWQQLQMLMAYQSGAKRIACRSGQGPGKTAITSVIGLHFCLAPNAKLIVTGPTMAQCKDAWLAQVKKLAKSPKAPKILQSLYECRETGFGVVLRCQ